MDANPRHDLKDYSFGVFAGFPFFFARRLWLPGIIHIIILALGSVSVIHIMKTNPAAAKWALLAAGIIEIAWLAFFGKKAGPASITSCSWKTDRHLSTSNAAWAFFGRLFLLLRFLNIFAFGFLKPAGRLSDSPPWVATVGFIVVPILLLLVIWRIRGPLWAIAYNTLKESISKLEVITLFAIGVVFVLLFNFVWLVPAVQDTVIGYFDAPSEPPTAVVDEDSDGLQEFKVSTIPQSMKFTQKEIQRAELRLKVQVAAFLFGEFFVALICFAIGIFLIPGEIQRGVVLTILPKPISRGEYVVGKILGGWLIAVICFESMAMIAMFFALPNLGKPLDNTHNILLAMLLMPVKYAILLSMITYFSLWLPELAGGFVGIVLFTAGHFTERILDLASNELAAIPLVGHAMKATYVMLPHLTWVFSPAILDPNFNDFTNSSPVFEWLFWACIYLAIVTTLAVLSFRKRSL